MMFLAQELAIAPIYHNERQAESFWSFMKELIVVRRAVQRKDMSDTDTWADRPGEMLLKYTEKQVNDGDWGGYICFT